MNAARAAEFLHMQIRVAAVEQEMIDMLRRRERFIHGTIITDMDHLNELHARQSDAQIIIIATRQRIDDLHRCGACARMMVRNGSRVGFACKEESLGRWLHEGGDLSDQRIVYRAGTARHAAHQADRVRSERDRHARFSNARDAADLDARRHGSSGRKESCRTVRQFDRADHTQCSILYSVRTELSQSGTNFPYISCSFSSLIHVCIFGPKSIMLR